MILEPVQFYSIKLYIYLVYFFNADPLPYLMFLKHSSLTRYDLDSHGEAVPITALESIIAFDMDMSKGDIFGISASSSKVSLLLINRNTVCRETFHLHNDKYIEFVLSVPVTAENKPESPESRGSFQPTRLSVRLCSV